jgi:hypothetical protein
VCERPLPGDFVSEVWSIEYGINQHFEIVARGRIAVQIKGTGRLENSMKLNQPDGHHCGYAIMSFSFKNSRIARSISAASLFPLWIFRFGSLEHRIRHQSAF